MQCFQKYFHKMEIMVICQVYINWEEAAIRAFDGDTHFSIDFN